MDWNNDGRIDGKDYTLFHEIVDKDSQSTKPTNNTGSYNALRRAGILTIGDLINRLNAGDVKNIRNLGLKSFSEIQTKILDFGFERLNEKEKHEFFWYLLENNAKGSKLC